MGKWATYYYTNWVTGEPNNASVNEDYVITFTAPKNWNDENVISFLYRGITED